MFGVLKKKFSQIVEAISKKTEEKEEVEKPEPSLDYLLGVETKQVETKEAEPEKIKIQEVEKREEVKERKSWIEKIKEGKPEPKKEEPIQEIKAVEEIKPEIVIKEEVEIPETVKEEPKEKKSFFKKVTEKLFKTITEKELTEEDLEPILNSLESGMIEADAAYEVAEKIKNDLKRSLVGKGIKRGKEKDVVLESLRRSLLEILSVPRIDLEELISRSKEEKRPVTLLFFGTNGVGKSLNLSKVAKYLKDKGHNPILAAGDTFRAAGDEQLEMYANKINVPVIRQQRGADSCAVIFDARKSAESRGYDVVLGDTSGRMHTKKELLDELAKIVRVNKPDLKILVLDSLSGSDVIQQFDFFDKAVGIDATIFSKVDVNEKGGNILSICYKFKKPILFLGTGQSFDDLTEFVPEKFVDSIIGS